MDEAIRKQKLSRSEIKRIRRKHEKLRKKRKAAERRNHQKELEKKRQLEREKRKNPSRIFSGFMVVCLLTALYGKDFVYAAETIPVGIVKEIDIQNQIVVEFKKIETETEKKKHREEIVRLEKEAITNLETVITSVEYEEAVSNMQIAEELIEEICTKKSEYSLEEYSIEVLIEKQKQAKEELEKFQLFYVTAYCGCLEICCPKPDGIIGKTASGRMAVAGRTVAMDPKYEFETKIYICGLGEYVVEDRGGDIKENRIDVYFPTHTQALAFRAGEYYVKIY